MDELTMLSDSLVLNQQVEDDAKALEILIALALAQKEGEFLSNHAFIAVVKIIKWSGEKKAQKMKGGNNKKRGKRNFC